VRTYRGFGWTPNPASVCWWDGGPIGPNEPRVPLPLDFDDHTKVWFVSKNEVFCSLNCCRAYNRNCQQGKWEMRDTLIVRFAKALVASNGGPSVRVGVLCAPTRAVLQRYGGPKTDQEFRQLTADGTTLIELPSPLIAQPTTYIRQRATYTPTPIPLDRIKLARQRVARRKAEAAMRNGTGVARAMGIDPQQLMQSVEALGGGLGGLPPGFLKPPGDPSKS
jgi:hypothetical protein